MDNEFLRRERKIAAEQDERQASRDYLSKFDGLNCPMCGERQSALFPQIRLVLPWQARWVCPNHHLYKVVADKMVLDALPTDSG